MKYAWNWTWIRLENNKRTLALKDVSKEIIYDDDCIRKTRPISDVVHSDLEA